MQRFTLSACSRCRQSLSRPGHPENWFTESQYLARRFRSRKTSLKFEKRPKQGFGNAFATSPYVYAKPPKPHKKLKEVADKHIVVEEVPMYLALRVANWARMPKMIRRLQAFGIPMGDIPILLKAFVEDVDGGLLTRPGMREKYTLDRFTGSYADAKNGRTDQVLTNIFYTWASDPDHQSFLETIVPQSTLHEIIRLHTIADISFPADNFPEARSLRRKFYMHVGPTNSGKTHAALRALAAAGSGCYGAPLRLLAHEVWERLNKGQIVPLGVDPDADAEPDTETCFNVMGEESSDHPTVRKQGNLKYARECNLLTGEENKMVAENAGLLSCTIEMIPTMKMYDVVVLDEIQLIADPERGYGWTKAVLGVYSKEIHLCGEETAIPIIEALLKDTGDELVINRYERLTPLVVQEQSLEGDLSRVQKGDCIVAFSRSGIFALKKQVEELTGMRCAVAYGRLPPEIRSEQAALFNDPGSGYDVMVGSDAIGLGLNLKIKRTVFHAMHKFNGVQEVRLSDSQVKQIAGRAGRYGLHGHDEPGGFTTTLHQNDLSILHKAITSPIKPITCAYLNMEAGNSKDIVDCLPLRSTSLSLPETYHYVSRMRWPFQFDLNHKTTAMCDFIDNWAGDVPFGDKGLLMMAPVPWNDAIALDVVALFIRQYRNYMRVDLVECLRIGPLGHLEDVEICMKQGPPRSSQLTLGQLESLHRLLVLYMWMSVRSPVAWNDSVEALELKERTERALDWSLQGVSWGTRSRQFPDTVTLRRRNKDDQIAYASRQDIMKRKQAEMEENKYIVGGKERAGF